MTDEEKEIDELAESMRVQAGYQKADWLGMAKWLINDLGYRKNPSPGLVSLDKEIFYDCIGPLLDHNEIMMECVYQAVSLRFGVPSQAVKWPDKIIETKTVNKHEAGYEEGWNACLEAWKQAVKEAESTNE